MAIRKNRRTIQDSKAEKNKPIKPWKFLKTTLFDYYCKPIIGALVIAITFYFLSRFLFFPVPEITIIKGMDSRDYAIYFVNISNTSKLEIHNFEITVKFDENYPVSDTIIIEPGLDTELSVKTYQNYGVFFPKIDKILTLETPTFQVSGITCATKSLTPGAVANIHVLVDKTYRKSNGDILPPSGGLLLRSKTYQFYYKYRPFGLLAPISFSESGTFDFDGKKAEHDNYRVYRQILKRGIEDWIDCTLDMSKKFADNNQPLTCNLRTGN